MLMALEESKRAYPECRPNPPVGCVLVRDSLVIAKGFTHPPGGYHAEAHALSNTAGSLDGVAAFVTLEPCSFMGRTPSCALGLIDRGISKVYVSVLDPHPRNRGKGVELLKSAGVEVEIGLCQKEVLKYISPYLIDS